KDQYYIYRHGNIRNDSGISNALMPSKCECPENLLPKPPSPPKDISFSATKRCLNNRGDVLFVLLCLQKVESVIT
ncbi:hypothetical protein L9F63_001827, partial [Diploptera punctata]